MILWASVARLDCDQYVHLVLWTNCEDVQYAGQFLFYYSKANYSALGYLMLLKLGKTTL